MLINLSSQTLVLAAALGAGLITHLKNWFNPSKKGNTNMFNKFNVDDGTFSPVTKRPR